MKKIYGNLKLKKMSKNNGYNEYDKSHKIMHWKETKDKTIIVYREIRIDNKGLFTLNNNASQ